MIEDFFTKYAIRDTDSLVVACSGGADSMYLLSEVLRIHPHDRIIVAHFNHLLRADESDADETFVRAYCDANALVFESSRADISMEAERMKKGIEETARILRYEFLERVRIEHDAKYILTAHHLDDSIETFVLNLIRGTKLGGLTGVPEQNGNILRPLLGTTKQEILNRLQELQIEFRTDSSNTDPQYHRNRIRANILPEFEQINPEYRRNIADFMHYAQELADLIEIQTEAFLGQRSDFLVSDFAKLSAFLQREVIRTLYTRANNGTIGLSEGNIAEMIRYILTAEGGTEKTIQHLRLTKRGGVVTWWWL